MSYWKLAVEQFGKIKHAEIEFAPLTLFVGDNNSGKSYLLSLLWALHMLGEDTVFSVEAIKGLESRAYDDLEDRLFEKIELAANHLEASIDIVELLPQLQCVINELLENNKSRLLKFLFNCDSVQIGKMILTMPDDINGMIDIIREDTKVIFKYQGSKTSFIGLWNVETEADYLSRRKSLCRVYVSRLIMMLTGGSADSNRSIYLPAARTGFMMTKDIVNKFARKKTYGVEVETEENNMEIQPFSRPIIDFLDVMNELSEEQKGNEELEDLVQFIQHQMVQGNVEISAMAGKELSYIPDGQKMHYPFRVTSAVVTELSPLLLLLQHQKNMVGLFYEEPEMCLHPALQKKMGQLLIRMVNSGIDVTATTHSDIILQHINNMIQLRRKSEKPENYDYVEMDLLAKEYIRVYQFSNDSDNVTSVHGLHCGENGFIVPTFNDALDKIMDETVQLQN